MKSSRTAPAELRFDFPVVSIVCLSDSVLAFHRHGVQGRSFLNNVITQDINDPSKTYEVLGSDKYGVFSSVKMLLCKEYRTCRTVVLRCRSTTITGEGSGVVDLSILTEHESTM